MPVVRKISKTLLLLLWVFFFLLVGARLGDYFKTASVTNFPITLFCRHRDSWCPRFYEEGGTRVECRCAGKESAWLTRLESNWGR